MSTSENPGGSNIKILLLSVAILAGFLISSDLVLFSALAVFAVCLFTKKGRRFLSSLGFRKQENWAKTIGIVILVTIGIMLMNQILGKILPSEVASEEGGFGDIAGNLPAYLGFLVSSVLIGGFIEEMLFRGFLLTRLPKIFGNSQFALFAIIVATSLVFGFAHIFQNVFAAISATLFSIIMGIIFTKTKSNLWLVILIHSLINAVFSTMAYLDIGA